MEAAVPSSSKSDCSSGDEWTDLSKSDYAKVIFSDLLWKRESGDIECTFTLTETVNQNPSDYIGLFKVGYEDISQCLASKTLSEIEGKNVKLMHCCFKSEELPELNGFYQFLYITQDKEVCGASMPFEVKQSRGRIDSSDEEVVTERVEDGFLMVRHGLEQKNLELERKNKEYQEEKIILMAEIKELMNEKGDIMNLLEELKVVKKQIETINVSLEKDNSDLIKEVKSFEEKFVKASEELESLQKSMDDLHVELDIARLDRNKAYRSERQWSSRFEFFTSENNRLEKIVKAMSEENRDIVSKLQAVTLEKDDLSSKLEKLTEELYATSSMLEKVTKEKEEILEKFSKKNGALFSKVSEVDQTLQNRSTTNDQTQEEDCVDPPTNEFLDALTETQQEKDGLKMKMTPMTPEYVKPRYQDKSSCNEPAAPGLIPIELEELDDAKLMIKALEESKQLVMDELREVSNKLNKAKEEICTLKCENIALKCYYDDYKLREKIEETAKEVKIFERECQKMKALYEEELKQKGEEGIKLERECPKAMAVKEGVESCGRECIVLKMQREAEFFKKELMNCMNIMREISYENRCLTNIVEDLESRWEQEAAAMKAKNNHRKLNEKWERVKISTTKLINNLERECSKEIAVKEGELKEKGEGVKARKVEIKLGREYLKEIAIKERAERCEPGCFVLKMEMDIEYLKNEIRFYNNIISEIMCENRRLIDILNDFELKWDQGGLVMKPIDNHRKLNEKGERVKKTAKKEKNKLEKECSKEIAGKEGEEREKERQPKKAVKKEQNKYDSEWSNEMVVREERIYKLELENESLKEKLKECHKKMVVTSEHNHKLKGHKFRLESTSKELEKIAAEKDVIIEKLETEKKILEAKYDAAVDDAKDKTARLLSAAEAYKSLYLEKETLLKKLRKAKKNKSLVAKTNTSRKEMEFETSPANLSCEQSTSNNSDSDTGEHVCSPSTVSTQDMKQNSDKSSETVLAKAKEILQSESDSVASGSNQNETKTVQDMPEEKISTVQQENPLFIDYSEAQPETIQNDVHTDMVKCSMCEKSFLASPLSNTPMIKHYEIDHNMDMCPLCGQLFEKSLPRQYLQFHVDAHFNSK